MKNKLWFDIDSDTTKLDWIDAVDKKGPTAVAKGTGQKWWKILGAIEPHAVLFVKKTTSVKICASHEKFRGAQRS